MLTSVNGIQALLDRNILEIQSVIVMDDIVGAVLEIPKTSGLISSVAK